MRSKDHHATLQTCMINRFVHKICTMISLSSRLHGQMSQHLHRSDRHRSKRSHRRSLIRGETPRRERGGGPTLAGQKTLVRNPSPAEGNPFAAILLPRTSVPREPTTQANSEETTKHENDPRQPPSRVASQLGDDKSRSRETPKLAVKLLRPQQTKLSYLGTCVT